MDQLGYAGLILLMLLENLFPPIPSELVMPMGGFSAARGDMTLWGVIAAGTAGAVLGAILLYGVGRWIGEQRVRRFADRHGAWLTVSGEDLRRAQHWFERHALAAVFFGRFVPALRSVISIPAGVAKMPLGRFLLATTLGSAIWAGALAYVGKLLGKNYRAVQSWLDPVTWAILGAIVIAYLVRVVRQRRAAA